MASRRSFHFFAFRTLEAASQELCYHAAFRRRIQSCDEVLAWGGGEW